MAFNEKIIEVQGLLDKVNATLETQKIALDAAAASISKYSNGMNKMPSDFLNAQKESIALSKAQQAEAVKMATIDKQAETVKQAQIATQIKLNAQKKSDIALSEAEARAQKKATDETNRATLANEKLNRAFVQLNNQRTVAKNKLQDLIASEKASNAEIRIAQKEFDALDKRVRKANLAVGNFTLDVGKYKNAMNGIGNLMGAFGISTGLYLGANIIKDIYETTKQLQSLDLALRMVSGSEEAFATNQLFLKNLAEQYGIEIKGLTKNFTEFWVASKGKLEAEQIKDIFTSISKSVAIMGLSVEQQDSAFLALQQMMSKGTVQAEELKKQLGNALPGAIKAATMAYQALHPELKVTEKLFMEQMKAGKVISAELLPELAKAYEKLYGIENVHRANTLIAAQERLSNSWTEMVRHMNESETGGIASFFKTVLSYLDVTLKELDRFINSWESIDTTALSKGRASGTEDYNKKLAEAKTPGQRQGLADFTQEVYRKQLIETQEKLRDVNEEIKRLDEATAMNVIKGLFGIQTIQMRGAHKLKEELMIAKGFAEAQLKAANQYNSDLGNPKKAAAGAGPHVETEAERKKRLKAEKDYQDYLEGLRKNAYDRQMSDLERELEIIKDNYANKKNLGNDYIRYAFQMADKEGDIIDARYAEEMRLAKKNGKSKEDVLNLEKIATNKYYTAQEDAYKKHLETLDKIKYDSGNGVTDTGPLADAEKYGSGTFMIDPKRIEEAVDEWKKYQEGVTKSAEELKKMKDLLREFYQQTEGNFFSEAGFDKTFEMFLKLDEYGKSTFDRLMEAAKATKEEFAVTFIAVAESAQEAVNAMNESFGANYDYEYDLLERKKENALRFAGESESGRAEIERQYETKRRQIARREAQAKKQMAEFNIFVDGAQAVVAFLAKGQWGQAIAAGILAGIQLAAVQSRDLPQFWKGTDYNPRDQWALTQEKGQEIITDQSGKVKDMGDNKGARLTYLKRGDKVLKNKDTLDQLNFSKSYGRLLSENSILAPVVNIAGGLSRDEFNEGITRLEQSIGNKPSFTLIDDENGRRLYREYRGHRAQLIDNRKHLVSIDV